MVRSFSSSITSVFHNNIGYILQSAHVFFSRESIPKDRGWFDVIEKELHFVATGIVFATQENVMAPWILFEAGALSKSLCILCCDFSKDDLHKFSTPLHNYNATDITKKDDVFNLFLTIKNAIDPDLANEVLKESFENRWPKMIESIELILNSSANGKESVTETDKISPLLVGTWQSQYRKGDHIGKETATIDPEGRYLLHTKDGPIYYFHLNSLATTGNNLIIQKIQVRDGVISESVHSVEMLHFEDGRFIGSDSDGWTFEYNKVKS